MSLLLADRVLETCSSPGTGAVTLLGATTGYQSFSSAIGNGNTCYYCIADQGGANWEVGVGTYSSSGNTLTRTTPLSGSAATPVNFSSGTQNVFVTYPAEKSINLDASGAIRADSNYYLDFANAAPSTSPGRMWYSSSTGSWNLGMGGGNITQQVGEELYIYGEASSAISGNTLLQLIFKTGTVGASGVLQFAPTTSGITDPNLILGVATEDIGASYFGRITTYGIIHGIDTTGSTYGETWADADVIWYNPTTGGLTKTKPTAPNMKYQIGTVLDAASSGSFQVDLHPGSELGGTDSNVQFSSVANNNLLQYNSTSGYWTNVTPGSVTGVGSVANAVTFNDSGSGASSGTTFDGSAARTVSYNTIGAQPAGTYVTSVTGTAPVVSSGGTTPAISMPAASSTVNGYLTSTDWNTFNGKGSGTVTSVSGTGSVNGITLSGTVTSSGSLTLGGTLSNVNLTSQVTGTLPITNGGTGQTTASAAFNALSPITTAGDLIIGNGSNSATRLAIGANSYVLTSNGTTASWQAASGGGVTVSATAPSSPTSGQLWYDSTNGVMCIYYGTQWVEDYESQLTTSTSFPDMNGGTASTTSFTYSLNCGGAL